MREHQTDGLPRTTRSQASKQGEEHGGSTSSTHSKSNDSEHITNSSSSSERQSPPTRRSKVLGSLPMAQAHENIYTLPNLLTVSRLVAAPFVGYAILHGHHAWALGLFAYAGVTDLLDGWIARRWRLGTVVGSVIDPMADKMLMTVLTVSLAVQGSLPSEWLLSFLSFFSSLPVSCWFFS